MKSLMSGLASGLIVLLPAAAAAVEEAGYNVLKKDGGFWQINFLGMQKHDLFVQATALPHSLNALTLRSR